MNDLLQNLVASLREEVKQYGELLALLEAQQGQVADRQTEELLTGVSAVNIQGNAVRVACRERLQRQRDLAQSLLLSPESPIAALISLLPGVYRPLSTALVDENDHLLRRVRQRARKNHLLLSRSLELMEEFINTFYALGGQADKESGTAPPRSTPGHALYEDLR